MTKHSINKSQQFLKDRRVREFYKTMRLLCGPMRFKIIIVLNKHKDGLTVSELAETLGVSLSRVSHQLAILRKHKLVVAKKINRETVYKLANHRLQKIFYL